MKKLFVLIALIAACLSLNAQAFNKQKLDSLFNSIEKFDKTMGSFSLTKEGKIVYQRTIGYVDINNQIKANNESKYRIGSISKTFTSTIIMQLIEENKLALSSRLDILFPAIPNAKLITIEQMLRHRSGLFNFTNAKDYPSFMEQPKSQKEMLEIIIKNGTVFEPDEKAEYSNTNYLLLTYIIEKVEKKSFSKVLEERITKPCNLKNTYFGGKINTKNNEALSYKKMAGWELDTETDMSIPAGAGGIVSTATDLNRFFTCLFSNQLVSEESLNQMKTMVDNYGLGLFQYPFFEKKAFGHTGGIDGFRSLATYFPEDKVSVAFVRNGENMVANDILIGALSIYFNRDYQLPAFSPAISLTSEELDQYMGVYSTPTFPLKLAITKNKNVLIAQGTGQPSFALEAFGTHKFKFDQANLKIEFKPLENKLILQQGGGTFELTRE